MANSNQLERIGALVERLEPLSNKTRGMRIEAEEWNGLVEVMNGLLQVERAQLETTQLSLEERYARSGHEHLGEVSLAWLDADLQTRVGGQKGSVSTRTVIADLEKKIEGLSGEVARLSTLVGEQQRQLDRASVNELDRGRILKQFDDRFSGVENLRTLVGTLSSDVRGVNSNIATLLELRNSLTDAQGNPINVSVMRQELSEVRGLRDVLQGADGDLIKLRDVELKLQELSDASGLGGEGALDLRIANKVAEAETRLAESNAEVVDTLRTDLTAASALTENRLRGELTTQLQTSATASDLATTQKVAAAEVRLGSALDAKLAVSNTQVRADILSAASTLVDQRLAVVPTQMRTVATSVLAEMRPAFQTDVRTALNADIDTRLATFRNEVGSSLVTMDTRIRTVEERSPGLIQSTVDTFGDELETRLTQSMDARFSTERQSIDASVAQQVSTATSGALGNIDSRIASSIDSRLSDLDARIDRSVTLATRSLPEEISREVNVQLKAADFTRIIDERTASFAQQLRTEQAQAAADLQARTSADLSSAMTILRGETTALRTELTKTIDTRLAANNTILRQEFSTSISKLQTSLKPEVFQTTTVLQPVTTISPIITR
jgi:hypothetical protein